MIGELDLGDSFVETVGKNSTENGNPLNPFPDAAFSFGFVFLFLMCIVLMNLLVSRMHLASPPSRQRFHWAAFKIVAMAVLRCESRDRISP